MSYIAEADLKVQIREYQMDQIIDEDDTIIEMASQDAESMIIDALHQYYDTTMIFAQTGVNRHTNVVLWAKRLTLYFIYERVHDAMVPERVIKHYDETKETLNKIAGGEISVSLPVLTVQSGSSDGKPKTKFRWGGEKKRSH